MTTKAEERLEKLLEQKKQILERAKVLEERAKKERARIDSAQRKLDTRKKVLVGAVVLKLIREEKFSMTYDELCQLMQKELTRKSERELFKI